MDNKYLVTKQYVNNLVKNLCDIIIDHVNNKDNAHSIDDTSNININDVFELSDNDVIPLKDIEPKCIEISVDDLVLDANHKFVSEDQIFEFSNKATKEDLADEILKYKEEARKEINEKFNQLLNNKDILDKLKILSRLLDDEDKSVDELLNSIIDSIKDTMSNHIEDSKHLTADDRIALDKLLKFINTGCADWEAEETEPNYIRNKPEYLKANGGNADTIDNYTLDEFRNRQLERMIIGHDDRATDKLSKTALTKEVIEKIYSIDNGIIGLTEGAYTINDIFSPKAKDIGELIFRGCGKGTVLNVNSFITSNNIRLEDITIYNSCVFIDSKTIFRNVNFINCKITFSDNSRLFKIIDCEFDKCDLHFNGAIFNSVIKDNIFKSTEFKFAGDSNIIKNNIFY